MFRVLIVDADPTFGQALAHKLEQNQEFPCRVVSVSSAAEAYAVAQQSEQLEQPYDVFLIDHRLGPDLDGIEVMQQLLGLSPRSEAIIFTLANDLETVVRAYQAGAFRYLHKPFIEREVIWILQSLQAWRSTRRERDRLRVLIQVAEAAQHALSLPELGAVIVQGGCQLGFERARLWLLDEETMTLRGLSDYGSTGDVSIANVTFAVADSLYASKALGERKPVIFSSQDLGESYMHFHYAERGFRAATGEWVCLPLWYRDHCLGMLGLDNHSTAHTIVPEQLQELTLLGQQVAGALYRVQLYEQEQRRHRELEVLADIGRLVASRAAMVNLDTLLREVRVLVGHLMDVRNFMLVLRDPIFEELDFRLHIEQDLEQPRRFYGLGEGLAGYVVRTGTPLLLANGSSRFRRKHNIKRLGPPSRCWLGVPLLIEGQVIGAMAVQSYDKALAYDAEDQRLLVAVADQVAGAIQTARLREEADQSSRRLAVLQQASGELLPLAEANVEWLWHTTLTVATAGYGLGFNRAMLFLIEDGGTMLRGMLGIGQLNLVRARRDWQRDLVRGLTFGSYLTQLRQGGFPATEIDHEVSRHVFSLVDDHSVFREVAQTRHSVIIPETMAAARLPAQLVQKVGETEYAALPLQVGNKLLGIVLVDNYHTRKPLESMPLAELETLLAQVALVYENRRQRIASDQLVEAHVQVLSEVANQPLRETLDLICRAAQGIAQADCVLIYPFTPDSTSEEPRYDIANTVHMGLHQPFRPRAVPSANGVTAFVLDRGLLKVDDVLQSHWDNGPQLATSSFLQRENIRSFIAVPLYDLSSEAGLGVLYLNYRAPQTFSDHDYRRAQSFAELAVSAIRTARLEEAMRSGRNTAELLSSMRGRELRVLSRVLSTALEPAVQREDVVQALLKAAGDLLDRDSEEVGLLIREWQATADPTAEPVEVRRQYYLDSEGMLQERRSDEIYSGLTGEAFESEQDLLVDDVLREQWVSRFRKRAYGHSQTRSELDVLIRLGGEVLGLFNIEAPTVDAFTREHLQIVRRLASAAALALDSVRRQENLHNILAAAKEVVAPTELEATLRAVLEAARQVAPGVSAVTIWYKDPETRQIVPGPRFGVRDEQHLRQDQPQENNVLARVMRAAGPIWATKVHEELRLLRRFVVDEQIESVAAFPLRVGAIPEREAAVGAMFFNYRRRHEFTSEERTLFPILAAFAATSVRDASRLEQVRKERERLQAAVTITRAVGTSLDLDGTLRRIMQTLHAQFPNTRPCVLTYRERTQSLEFAPASMEFYPFDDQARVVTLDIAKDKSIACRVAREALRRKEPICENVRDTRQDPDYYQAIRETCSEICLALLGSNRELLGVLVLESAQPDAFGDDDTALITGVGPAISIAIERAYQSDRLSFNTSVAHATALVHELAHDIKGEIGSIRRLVYQLKRDLAPRHQTVLAQIDRSAELLVAYSRAPQETEKFAIDDWLRDRIPEITVKWNPAVGREFHGACANLMVDVSPVLLERTLRHLARNAYEAMDGRGVLTIRTRPLNGSLIEVLVTNTNSSILDTIRPGLFRKEVTTKEKERGGGRGLLFVRWAVQAMGGTIDLFSKPGEPVTFGFTLPAAAQSAEAKEKS